MNSAAYYIYLSLFIPKGYADIQLRILFICLSFYALHPKGICGHPAAYQLSLRHEHPQYTLRWLRFPFLPPCTCSGISSASHTIQLSSLAARRSSSSSPFSTTRPTPDGSRKCKSRDSHQEYSEATWFAPPTPHVELRLVVHCYSIQECVSGS